jgi:tRNA G18 (ribose-2'-O)-methylase SpoU
VVKGNKMPYFGIGVYHPKTEHNIGTLLRSAKGFGASFLFMIGPRFKPQNTDTTKAHKHIPTFSFQTLEDLKTHLPFGCMLVGIEKLQTAFKLNQFSHPVSACYLLGAEDHGLPEKIIRECHLVVELSGTQEILNVASVGSIVMYDRMTKWHNRT